MKILLTGSSSGLGHELHSRLVKLGHNVVAPTRHELDLSCIDQVIAYTATSADMLINCAGTGIGGKIDFCNHRVKNVVDILNTNFVAPVVLCHKVLNNNPGCKIVNVSSTNVNHFWPGDLAYSLSKQSLSTLGSMLRVEYPALRYLEVRLGLTKTSFNKNRYANEPDRFVDLYASHKYQTVDDAVTRIVGVLFDDNVKFIEVSP